MGKSLRARLERLEREPGRQVTIWDVWLGGADPAQADPETRATFLSLFAPRARDEPDEAEREIARVLALPEAKPSRGAEVSPESR